MKNNPKRDLILRAGSECFARYGFDKTTLDDIGRRAGLNKASLYYYFKNKEEILAEVALTDTQHFIADLKTKMQAFPDVRRQIRFYLSERIRRFGEISHLMSLPVLNQPALEALMKEANLKIKETELAFLTDLLKKGVASNTFAYSEPSASIAEFLYHLSDALKHDVVYHHPHRRMQESDFSMAVERMEHLLKLVLDRR